MPELSSSQGKRLHLAVRLQASRADLSLIPLMLDQVQGRGARQDLPALCSTGAALRVQEREKRAQVQRVRACVSGPEGCC